MSVVTNILLCTGLEEEDAIRALNIMIMKWPHAGLPFRPINEMLSAGSKHLECDIWPGGFNHFELDKLTKCIEAVSWTDPGQVQLFVKGQNDSRFREISLSFETGRGSHV